MERRCTFQRHSLLKKKIVTEIWKNIFVSHILVFTTGTINFNFPETLSPLTIHVTGLFLYPPDYIKKSEVFRCFQGVTKETSGMKWVKLFFLVPLADIVSENFKPAYTRKLRNSKQQFKISFIFQFWLTKTNNKTWSNYTLKSWAIKRICFRNAFSIFWSVTHWVSLIYRDIFFFDKNWDSIFHLRTLTTCIFLYHPSP